jgi:uncharacterized protein
MPKVITERSFYKYLKCPSWIAHEVKEEQLVEDSLRVKLQDDGLIRERQLALLANRPIVEVVTEDQDEAMIKTVDLMAEGVQTIYRPVLAHHHWIARPDILERVEGKSTLGDYYYVACDIKRSRRLKDEYCFQGSFYALLLAEVQGTTPIQGYVMHPDGVVEGYLLETYTTKFHLTMDAIERILNGEEEPHFLTSDCKQSPWFHVCKHGSAACDDLSRLNRVWRSEVKAIDESGIHTVTDFAKTTKEYLAAHVSGIPTDRLAFLQEQAKALIDDRIITLGAVDFDPGADALIIDVESDPLRNDFHYLIGVLEVHGVVQSFHSFLAKKPDEEAAMWQEFCAYLASKPAMPIYHYGYFEVDVIKTLAERHGVFHDMTPAMIMPRMVDVLTKLRDRVIFPLSFYSLKDVAKYLGFHWRTSEASGMDSISWYEDWLQHGKQEDLERIVQYNEDDVRATWHIVEWARSQGKK